MEKALRTKVIDGGARYGVHPTWKEFVFDLDYYAFEPDQEECERLEHYMQGDSFKVINKALWNSVGDNTINIFSHKGQSSFLGPNLESDWFKNVRANDGIISEVRTISCETIDNFASSNSIDIDFIKLDIEGVEYDALMGGGNQLKTNILGARLETHFHPNLLGQRLFPDLFNLMLQHGFELINIDYFGRGIPRSEFYGNPDPKDIDRTRYGVMNSADGVWVRKLEWMDDRFSEDKILMSAAYLKYAWFCMLNNAPDVAVHALSSYILGDKNSWPLEVEESLLYKSMQIKMAEYLGQWRAVTDDKWNSACALYKELFSLNLAGGDEYYSFIRNLKSGLSSDYA